MKHIKDFETLNENTNGLNYCSSCNFLLKPNDNKICKFCKILDIIGITKETADNIIYGQLKYLIRFKPNKLIDYIEEIKEKYNLSNEQVNKIKDILKIKKENE